MGVRRVAPSENHTAECDICCPLSIDPSTLDKSVSAPGVSLDAWPPLLDLPETRTRLIRDLEH